MADQIQETFAEARRKTTQIATAGIIGVVVFGFMIWGVVKFFPISSQLTLLINTVENLEEKSEDHADSIEIIESEFSIFRLDTFPTQLTRINEQLIELTDIAGDNKTKVDQIEHDVEVNTQDHVSQKDRANTRSGVRLVRDKKIDDNTALIKDINEWRDSLQYGRVDLLIEQITILQRKVQKLEGEGITQ